jgi:hypothetical protein
MTELQAALRGLDVFPMEDAGRVGADGVGVHHPAVAIQGARLSLKMVKRSIPRSSTMLRQLLFEHSVWFTPMSHIHSIACRRSNLSPFGSKLGADYCITIYLWNQLG